ncbi:MAG: 3-hydroxybutyrate dehydrogenase [Alphaproteobacteria bacterium]|nr:3-hydroxybutyrate dehydrogenase [Alphaproteobacteria bacterium]
MLKGKVAIVTGSTSGIGLGIAEVLASQHCDVMLNGFGDEKMIAALQARLQRQYKVKIGYHGADMAQPDEIHAMVKATRRELGSVDILVNNAGIQHVAPIEEFPRAKWDAIVAVNLSAPFHATQAAIPHMRKKKWGRIINIASAHGLVASRHKSAYVAAKHGLVGLTKVTALEMAGSGITCNAICPGWVLTPLVQKQVDERAHEKRIKAKEAELDLLAEKQPSQQFVTPEQIGKLVLFLCSSGADQMTGSSLAMDGGWTAQ